MRRSEYDAIAREYDALYSTPEYKEEDKYLMDLIGDLYGSVLDVGCGTGLLLDYKKDQILNNYLGIDPSSEMIAQLRYKHPEIRSYQAINTDIEGLFTDELFDNVICLFAINYIKDWTAITRLWNGKGMIFATFHKDDYDPVAHEELGIDMIVYRHNIKEVEKLFGVEAIDYRNNWIIKL
jgi:SAM-dependent methyltransferase